MAHPDGAWHEATVGVCQPLARTADQRLTPHPSWPRLCAHALAAGVADPRCQVVALLGQGRMGSGSRGPPTSPPDRDCVEILDCSHAVKHVTTVAHARGGRRIARRRRWRTATLHALKTEGPAPLLAARAVLAPPTPAAQAVVAREAAHVTCHQTRRQHPMYIARGLPIGSGRVEGACNTLAQPRLRQSGMHWPCGGAQVVAPCGLWPDPGGGLPSGRPASAPGA